MPSYDPELTSGDPYYDDFDKTKNYLKILFKPGFAVQARELTQLQTALQTQIERFGDHVFKNGTPVLGSGLTEKNVGYVRATGLSEANRALIDGDFVTGTGDKSNLRARVVSTEAPLSTGPDTFPVVFLQYLSGGGTAGDSFGASDEIYSETQSVNFAVKSTTADLVAPTGDALACSIDTGVFYVDGFFVYVNPQTNIPTDYQPRIKLKVPDLVKKELPLVHQLAFVFTNSQPTELVFRSTRRLSTTSTIPLL